MAENAQGTEKLAALREALRRADTVLAFARKVLAEGGEVPPGLLEDFDDARREVEKDFVFCYSTLDHEAQKSFRNFLQVTKGINQKRLEKNLPKLSRRTRSLLNRIVISEGTSPSASGDVAVVRFNDHDPPHVSQPAASPVAAAPASQPAANSTSASRSLRRVVAAVVLISVLGLVAILAAWMAGAFSSAGIEDNRPDIAANATPSNLPAGNTAPDLPVDPDAPFDAVAAGYTHAPTVMVPLSGTNPLDVAPGAMVLDQLPALLLGFEELVYTLEPERLSRKPSDTRAEWAAFAQGVVAAEPKWRDQRKPLLDAFVAHLRTELHLARYPADSNANVLPSDVLYSAGASQLPLVVTVQALAQGCSYGTLPLAPNGPSRPELSLRLRDKISTWNGEALGLRTGNHPVLKPQEALLELALLLRATMKTERGRILADAMILHLAPLFTAEMAQAALTDLDHMWLAAPSPDTDDRDKLMHRLSKALQPAVCRVLTAENQAGTVNDALKLYRIANAAGDTVHARAAMLLLGKRAEKGAMLDGQPLAYVVAELLAQMNRPDEAEQWYRRAHDEHPDDPRAALRLADRTRDEPRFALLREAYARGERSAAFMRQLARAAAQEGEGLLTLAVLDELCAGKEFDALDLENAALQCIALEHTDWALERLARHADLVGSDARLQRLDLICELSVNGLSPRAKELAAAWRTRGQKDPQVESLLQRYGG
ncbi:MAG: tetratricopeptide repeat protein [Planctomycetes bacterium]|nr:tetratricopeptide repeat protein [Planctomycetota bacterium]